MIRGDGIRRNIAQVDADEVAALIDAIKQLNVRRYRGSRDELPVGGVSLWFKQDEIHQATHVHDGPEFLPWHRELCNRFEHLIRSVDPRLSLHYWDWTTDPSPLFAPNGPWGSKTGDVGEPWLGAGFYKPDADPFRGKQITDVKNANPFDPPRALTREVEEGAPQLAFADDDIIGSPDYRSMRIKLESSHDGAHGYIGGTIGNAHTSFRDPFVFLLHSNADRLFAMWQYADPAQRLNPITVYGDDPEFPVWFGRTLNPWDGQGRTRPWVAPEFEREVKDYRHPSVVEPPLYDTLPQAGDGQAATQKVEELRHLLEDPAVRRAARSFTPT
ncbi:MAG: tyrosinase family protein [Streptomyces sp.]|nr:tyrosinase family protein [Streptomyces sp.]